MHLNLKFLSFLLVLFIGSVKSWPNFNLYTKNSPKNYIKITSQNISNSVFDRLKETKFLIHGFGDNGYQTSMLKIKDELLVNLDLNVIVVDWEKGAAGPIYSNAVNNVKIVGKSIGEFIIENKINQSKVHCIGHSLGAHACGFAGKVIKLRRISGLDPAGPLFRTKPKEYRLDRTDADLVDVIHTDWFYGLGEDIGHKNFHPNGGDSQNGCGLTGILRPDKRELSYKGTDRRFDTAELVACSHIRVPLYYAESINSNCRFKAVKCKDYVEFRYGRCRCNPEYGCALMGYWSDQQPEEGVFYLDTHKTAPFCIS